MAKNIDPKLKKIGDYLRLDESAKFSIPEYQRAYSWGSTQCDKLWQDITAFIDSDGNDPYFFGTIIVNCLENDSVYSLIDGQQRTSTFLLLLKALLIRLIKAIAETSKDSDSESLNDGLKAKRNAIMKILYKIDDEDIADTLKDFSKIKEKTIIENRSINELFKGEMSCILEAVDFSTAEYTVTKIPYKQKDNKFTPYFRNFKYFSEQLELLAPSEINTFAKVFLEKCEIIEIRSWNVEQAITMFNSLNSDGMPLLDADIISAQLYAKAGNDKDLFNEQWRKLLEKVTALASSGIASVDAILMQFMYINRARKNEYITDSGSINVTTPGLRRYYTETDNGKELMAKPLALCDELLRIADNWEAIKDYGEVKLLRKFNENARLYMAGYLSRYTKDEIDKADIVRLCRSLLKLFTVLELVDTGYSSSRFKTFLFGMNVKLVNKSIGIEEIERDFDEHISRQWERGDIGKEIAEYDKNILVFLNEYLFAEKEGLAFDFDEKCDIEHIMPSSGKNLAHVQQDADISDADEFKSLVNKLGNKILLEQDINRHIGDAWFRTKIQFSIDDKKGYRDSRYAIAAALAERYKEADKPYWKKEDISLMTTKIAQRIAYFIFGEE